MNFDLSKMYSGQQGSLMDPRVIIPIALILITLYFMYRGKVDKHAERAHARTKSTISRVIRKYTQGSPY